MPVRAIPRWLSVLLPLLLALSLSASPAHSARRVAGDLTLSPTEFYGGQAVTFSGTLATSGTRKIWLEFHMNRPGDEWTRIPGFTTYTRSDGSFRFTQPARGMLNIILRVASRTVATPGVVSRAEDQEVAVSVTLTDQLFDLLLGSDLQQDYVRYAAVVSVPYVVQVDTSPVDSPVLPGRRVTLQKQVASDRWQTISSGITNSQGVARFAQVVTQPGTVTYRARLESWTEQGSRIGWFPSFPTTVDVMSVTDLLSELAEDPEDTPVEGPPPGTRKVPTPAVTSARAFGWWPVRFDYDWEYGESLTDKPTRGTHLRGAWVDATTGSGRAARHNAGLMLESKYGRVVPRDSGPGDRGSVSATLQGNAQKFGRWEVRIRPWVIESGGHDYRVRFELVPEDPAQRLCGARSITVADIAPRTSEIRYGVNTPPHNREWRGIRSAPVQQVARAYAVEVARDHVSWFLDGQLIGTVRARAAVPRVPLTIRLSLVGDEKQEMNHTYAIMDWIRAYSLEHGKRPANGAKLTAGKHTLRC
ncbi:MAG TPA: hypothetical protein VFK41_08865 [Nocardioidaceae bacterium]|nr:hypothetical protein [Nocardioidaceae bacterium]